MSDKSYKLSNAQRIIVHDALTHLISSGQFRPGYAPEISEVYAMFAVEHPVDPEIIGRTAIMNHLKDRGFKGREFDGMTQFCWGDGLERYSWLKILEGLNREDVVVRMLRCPNIGTITVRSVLLRCIANGWIRDPDARKNADRYLTETAPQAADRRTGSRARKNNG